MPVLTFFVAKLVVEGGKKKAVMYLRHQCANDQEEDLTASEASLTAFCFPLGPESVVPKEYMASEEYTFTLTGGDGKRYQGFCRKFLPPKPVVGSKLQLPQVLCLMSEDPWATFYFKVLQMLEHLVKSGDALLGSNSKQLPSSSHTAVFLQDLGRQLSNDPRPSEIVRVALPKSVDIMGVSPHRLLGNPLGLTDEYLELQVPLDCGNGRWNCGISLARLLWDVPIPALTTLLASMLLERRIILVSSQRDTVTAAVQAASALLYPFKWHHIYLPMLPQAFKDYLSAPMPFMVGLQSQMLHTLSSIPMDEITVIDLDIRSCRPAPGSAGDDARGLPWREHLEAALSAAHRLIRSPTEHETSPLIASIMQEYYVKLFGNYRRFIHADTPALNAKWAAQVASPSGATPQHSPRVQRESMSGRATTSDHADRSQSGATSGSQRGTADNVMKAAGYVFEHTAFVRSHRRNDKARTFLSHLRGSQLYAMFVQERLEEAAAAAENRTEGMQPADPFEQRVDRYQERRRMRFDKHRASKTGSVITRQWNSLIKKHRRTDSEEANILGGSLDLGAAAGGIAASMRRIITFPTTTSLAGAAPSLDVDPASFFPDDDDDDYEDLMDSASSSGRIGTDKRVLSASSAETAMHQHRLDRVSASFASPGPGGLQQYSLQPSNHRLAAASIPLRNEASPSSALQGSVGPVQDTQQGMTALDGNSLSEATLGSMLKLKSAVTDFTSALGRRVNSTATATGNTIAAAASSVASSASSIASGRSGYRPQVTGDTQPRSGLSRLMPQSTSLLDEANGRLRPPPSSSRPLLASQQQGSYSSADMAVLPSVASTTASSANSNSSQQPPTPVQPHQPLQHTQQPSLPAQPTQPSQPSTPAIHVPVSPHMMALPAGQPSGATVHASGDMATLIDGFDGFALLASTRSEPSAQQLASGHATVSLLDL